MRFDKLAERQILRAQAEGKLDNLKGAGQPLASTTGDTAQDAGFRIMAEAGALPREIELRKAVAAQRATLAAAPPEVRAAEAAKLADLELRLAIEAEARRRFQAD
ncbi:DnaJ family domain-containing protein [Paracoccus sp. p4-l81]|uniref:DnaJ family domain-containing protein n=1 Tax=unclassified Paracoccus (in: a-proteobacteria) TaxID=2688777 RepID=UPI0035BA7918